MWHKAEWMGRPMRIELTRVSLLVELANRYTTRGTKATETVLSPWLAADEDKVSHVLSHVLWWK